MKLNKLTDTLINATFRAKLNENFILIEDVLDKLSNRDIVSENDTLREELRILREDIQDFKVEMEESYESIISDKDSLINDLTSLENTFTEYVSSSTEEILNLNTKISNEYSNITAKIENLNEILSGKVTELQLLLNNLTSDFTDFENSYNITVTEIQSNIETLTQTVSSLQTEADNILISFKEELDLIKTTTTAEMYKIKDEIIEELNTQRISIENSLEDTRTEETSKFLSSVTNEYSKFEQIDNEVVSKYENWKNELGSAEVLTADKLNNASLTANFKSLLVNGKEVKTDEESSGVGSSSYKTFTLKLYENIKASKTHEANVSADTYIFTDTNAYFEDENLIKHSLTDTLKDGKYVQFTNFDGMSRLIGDSALQSENHLQTLRIDSNNEPHIETIEKQYIYRNIDGFSKEKKLSGAGIIFKDNKRKDIKIKYTLDLHEENSLDDMKWCNASFIVFY